jgi:hypothetical protein
VEALKTYLHHYRLRMVGVKAVLLGRIEEHLKYDICVSCSQTLCNRKIRCNVCHACDLLSINLFQVHVVLTEPNPSVIYVSELKMGK